MHGKWNILFYEGGTQGGGSFESLYQILKHLDRTRFNPIVVFVNFTKYLEKTRKLGIKCCVITDPLFSLHANKALRSIAHSYFWFNWKLLNESWFGDYWLHYSTLRKIENIASREHIHLIHMNNQIARDHFIAYGKFSQPTPIVSYLRSQKAEVRFRGRIRRVNPRIAQYIAYSRWVGEIWERAGVDGRKVSVLHNSIDDRDADISAADLHRKYGIINDGGMIIGCVGNFDPTRKYEFAIKALRSVIEQGKNVRLLLVGGGDQRYRESLIRLVKRLGLVEHVFFGDRTSDAKPVIKALDALIIPYEHEPFGRVMLEAWMLKTPVVLTDTGFIRDIVSHKETGMLAAYGDEQELAAAIVELLTDDGLKNRIIENARRDCLDRFCMKAYIRQLEAIYENALG